MFTGIIKKVEKVTKVTRKNQSIFVSVSLPKDWKLKEGESIAINGICSTVRNVDKKSFEVEYMPETIKKTTVSDWFADFSVNVEQSMKLSSFVDGHLVLGHIDTVAKIIRIEKKGDSKIFTIKLPKEYIKYIAPKGSVAVDGISLTVVDVTGDCFTVSLVSYTLLHTNFGNKKVGALLNIETDTIAKYVFNILKNNTYAKKTK